MVMAAMGFTSSTEQQHLQMKQHKLIGMKSHYEHNRSAILSVSSVSYGSKGSWSAFVCGS